MTKSLIEILVSIVLLLAFSPVLLATAILIYLEDRGPIIFQQERVGLHGQLFHIYKFRSMVPNADVLGGHQTETGDHRITRIGRFIRKTSIDELPQIANVLLREMSFVGPRPNVFVQKSQYANSDWEKRNSVRPGITGLAQIKGRSSIDSETRTKYDLEYVENHSFAMDIYILGQTLKVVFTG